MTATPKTPKIARIHLINSAGKSTAVRDTPYSDGVTPPSTPVKRVGLQELPEVNREDLVRAPLHKRRGEPYELMVGANQSLKIARRSYDDAKQTMKEERKQNETILQRLGEIERRLDEKGDQIVDLTKRVARKDVQIGNLETHIGDLEKQMGEKDVQIGDLRKEVNEKGVKDVQVRKSVRKTELKHVLLEKSILLFGVMCYMNEKIVGVESGITDDTTLHCGLLGLDPAVKELFNKENVNKLIKHLRVRERYTKAQPNLTPERLLVRLILLERATIEVEEDLEQGREICVFVKMVMALMGPIDTKKVIVDWQTEDSDIGLEYEAGQVGKYHQYM